MAFEHDIPYLGMEALADLVIVVERDTTIRFVNSAIRRVLGFEPRERIGTSIRELLHPDDVDFSTEWVVGTPGASDGPRPPIIIRAGTADGSWRRLEIVANNLLSDERIRAITIVAREVANDTADEAQRARNEQYRLIVESARHGVWLIDEHAVTTFVNPAVGEMLGYATDEILGCRIYDFMDEDAQAEAETQIARRRDGMRDRLPIRLRHESGHEVWLELDSSPLTDAQGTYAGAILLLSDITEERHVEAALRHERERFRTLMQESAELTVIAMADGTIDYASPAVERVLGYRPEELRGRLLEDLLLDPGEAPALRSGVLAPASRNGDTVPNELRLKHRDGSIRYCEVVARNLIDDPSVRGILVNAHDVTDARRAERRLRALFEASNDIVTILQPDGNWFASPAGTRLLGHLPGYEPDGGLLSLVHADDLAGAAAALADVLDGRRSPLEPLEFRARTADGDYRCLEAVANDLRDDPLVGGVVITARDITERNRQAAALRESEERFAAAFERSPVAIAVIGFDGDLIDCNEAYSETVGIPISELIGTDAMALVHPDDAERAVETAIAHMDAETRPEQPPAPIRMLRSDETEVWVRFASQIVNDSAGEPAYVVATMNDVTEQKDAEEALHRSEHWFRTLVQNQSDLITVVGFDGVLSYVSPNCETVLGFTPSEMIGTTGETNIHPDDLERLMTSIGDQISGDAEAQPVEYRQRHADGSWAWLEATARMMPPEYGSESVLVTARDVGERRRAERERHEVEARFREAFASSPVGIGFADLGGKLTWVNRALANIVGIPEDLLRETQFQALSRAGELKNEIAKTQELLRGEIESFDSEKRYDHPDGRVVWGLLHVSLVRDASGAPAQLLGQVEDITDRKERELLLAHDAEHDNLTGLWNRKGFRRIADDVWADRRLDAPVALLFADLDRFKEVNDKLGHSSGDEVLVNVGRRLASAVRAGDTVARWGGDEFVVLCPSVSDADEASRIAERVRQALGRPFRISAGVAEIGVSIGIALDDGHRSPEALLEDADVATYRAKLSGRDGVTIAKR